MHKTINAMHFGKHLKDTKSNHNSSSNNSGSNSMKQELSLNMSKFMIYEMDNKEFTYREDISKSKDCCGYNFQKTIKGNSSQDFDFSPEQKVQANG